MESKIDTVESSLDKRINGFQSEIDQKFDILQKSISKLASQQHVHQEEGNPKGECLIDTMLGEQAQLQLQEELKEELAEAPEKLQDAPQLCVVYKPWRKQEEILSFLGKEGNGKEVGEEPQKPTTQATNSPLPCPSPVYILPSPAAHSKPETPTAKAIPSTLHALQNLKKLVAIVQTFATTSQTLAVSHIAWHSGWFECWFRFGAPEPQHFYKLHQFQQPPKA